ncbi:LysM domain protein [Teladorsagia circumcincta]|uniref:LysM domain protein n=1 Tax=Teladorsagia circumcincta TaxID=45464 RepID=A0A2G9V4F2_TELCI|nr:LysM domain protein [Teladorsagia circumcincta]
MDYTVSGTDSLESIAASHDCTVGELMKLNRMSSRMVFPGQRIQVPFPSQDSVFESDAIATSTPRHGNQIAGGESAADGIRKGPGGAVPAQHQRGGNLMKTQSAPLPGLDEADSDCLQRFLKIKVKQVTESDGTVSGTLLVTPNCLMFDPDVTHPLVKENGQDLYGMVANMDEIVSVSVYKEISALTGDKEDKKKDIFDPNHVRTPATSVSHQSSTKGGSEIFLPSIDEESQNVKTPDEDREDRRTRTSSDVVTQEEYAQVHMRDRSSTSSSSQDVTDRPRSYSELDAGQAAGSGSRFSPNVARRSFGKLGRTLSARAKSIQGSVAHGTKQVAHGVVTHTKSAADSLQTGLETGVKVVGEAANAAANQAKVHFLLKLPDFFVFSVDVVQV